MKSYVIIGNGVAAAGCIEGIRSVDKDTKITVISAENHPVYCRPLISYYLENKTTLDKMSYRDADFYEKNKCDVIYGKQAVKIDKDGKSVTLDDATNIKYDSLCIASGSSPFIPSFAGLETVQNKFSFMTIDDTLALEKAITKEKQIVFLMQIGGKLKSGKPHDGRAPDYDDWSLNGDILMYYPVLDCCFELSSMGIRVDENSLLDQIKKAGCEDRLELEYHRMILNKELPYTIGGGIGQSRLCMLLLRKAHIGEVQVSIWPEKEISKCKSKGINLL